MHSIESPHTPPEFWLKRQQIQKLKSERPMFEQLMVMTNKCMLKNPHLQSDVKGAIQCETIHPQTMSKFNNYTFHTHPHADIDYPSDVDIQTTKELGKDYLLIGLAKKNKVVVYSKHDGFKKKVAEF